MAPANNKLSPKYKNRLYLTTLIGFAGRHIKHFLNMGGLEKTIVRFKTKYKMPVQRPTRNFLSTKWNTKL